MRAFAPRERRLREPCGNYAIKGRSESRPNSQLTFIYDCCLFEKGISHNWTGCQHCRGLFNDKARDSDDRIVLNSKYSHRPHSSMETPLELANSPDSADRTKYRAHGPAQNPPEAVVNNIPFIPELSADDLRVLGGRCVVGYDWYLGAKVRRMPQAAREYDSKIVTRVKYSLRGVFFNNPRQPQSA